MSPSVRIFAAKDHAHPRENVSAVIAARVLLLFVPSISSEATKRIPEGGISC